MKKRILIYILIILLCGCNNSKIPENKINGIPKEIVFSVDSFYIYKINYYKEVMKLISKNKKEIIREYTETYPDLIQTNRDNSIVIDSGLLNKLNIENRDLLSTGFNENLFEKNYSIITWDKNTDVIFRLKEDSIFNHLLIFSPKNEKVEGIGKTVFEVKIDSNWRYVIREPFDY